MSYQLHASNYMISEQRPYYYQHVTNRPLSTDDHSHDFYEIYILVKGSISQVVGGVFYQQETGSVVLIQPGEPHQILAWSSDFELFCLSVSQKEVNQFLEVYGIRDRINSLPKRQINLDSREIHEICMLFRRMLVMAQTSLEDCCRITMGLVVHEFIKSLFTQADEWMTMVLEQMSKEENLSEGVPALLRISHLSHAQLCRIVKKQLNVTPQQYVKDLRLNYAYDMIQGTDVDCQEVALRIGYSSYSHFCTTFKKKFNISPAELRRNSRLLHL